MAKDHSMDISVKFDFQELKNAVEQTKKEAITRYDLKDAKIEIELSETNIKITAQNDMQIESVHGMLIQKMVKRGVSSKVLDRQKVQEIGGMRVKQEINLLTALDKENAKKITKAIKEINPKAKASIQGETVRVSSNSIDNLQEIMRLLQSNEKIQVPLDFGNYK